MVYTKDDPRSALSTAARGPASSVDGIAAPEYLDFSITAPSIRTDGGSVQWIARGQNFVLIHTQPAVGDVIWNAALGSEQVLLLTDEDSAISGRSTAAEADDSSYTASGPSLVVVPPGSSRIVATGPGAVTQLIQADEEEWAQQAANADSYRMPHPRVAPLEPWPEPSDGYRWRVYSMSDVPAQQGRFGRIFRTRAFMVNFIAPSNGPRDLSRMSPHFHDDFEQASLVVKGDYVHHIQTPWGTDGTRWREEDHVRVGSPSLTIIPPPTVHTSQSLGWAQNQLIDIFSPPRTDFSAQPGWVLNAEEYPAPSTDRA